MKCSVLIETGCSPDPDITGLTADSREVRPGFLFAALPGVQVDGARFIRQAVSHGAGAILVGGDVDLDPEIERAAMIIRDATPRRRLAELAAKFYGGQPETVIGVTGTNGKTSTAWFLAQIWAHIGGGGGGGAGSLGTLGVRARVDGRVVELPLQHTTPDPTTLHSALKELHNAGVDKLAMEVSSHGLAQYRADGVRFAGAGFTNITQDHLDYHPTFDAYMAAKSRLFTELIREDGFVALNAGGAGAAAIMEVASARGLRLLTSGAGGRDVPLVSSKATPAGLIINTQMSGRAYEIETALIGAFQAENALLAAALAIGSGVPTGAVMEALGVLTGPPGRMQFVAELNGGAAFVDYAHTPDAVRTALLAARPHVQGKLIAIIGAGGDRDAVKRPLMGRAARDAADYVIVTDDNPRTENPMKIRRAILDGAPGAKEIGDRREAIAHGLSLLQAGDVLLVAGKGHETGQTIGNTTYPFNDYETVLEVVRGVHQQGDGS